MDHPNNCRKNWKKWIFPFVAIIMIILVLQLYYSRRQIHFTELYPQNGILDITDIEFSDEVYNVVNQWDYYPHKLG